MSKNEKVALLRDILSNYLKEGKQYLFSCPKCKHHKRKLSINFKLNKFKCWICDFSGSSIRYLVKRYGNTQQLNEWDRITGHIDMSRIEETGFEGLYEPEEKDVDPQRLPLPPEFVSLINDNKSRFAHQAIKFLKKRGITEDDIRQWKIGYCPGGEYGNRIVVPSFDSCGYINYYVGRAYTNQYPKYKNPPISRDIVFNELHINWKNEIVLVEGVFDAIVAGPNSIPILGSSLKEDARLFQKIVENKIPVYMALDPDMEKKTSKLINKLISYGTYVYKINIEPYLDVGEMTKKEFIKRKKHAVFLNSENYLFYELLHSL